jgi:hypothetical protein
MGYGICQEHWDMLRKAIDDRGLTRFVAKSGKEAFQNTINELDGKEGPEDYDPLMSCNWMIMAEAIRIGGVEVLSSPDTICPICKIREHNLDPEVWKDWIDGPADAALDECKKRGLLKLEE